MNNQIYNIYLYPKLKLIGADRCQENQHVLVFFLNNSQDYLNIYPHLSAVKIYPIYIYIIYFGNQIETNNWRARFAKLYMF